MPLAAPVLRLALRSGVCSDQVARLLQLAGLSTAEDSAQNTLLTGRQLEILRLMAAGYSNQAIADQLVISLATVKSHVVNIMNRLGVSSRMEAVAQARQTGLL
jgi:DNA-binding NarL/FixJ family response regulator